MANLKRKGPNPFKKVSDNLNYGIEVIDPDRKMITDFPIGNDLEKVLKQIKTMRARHPGMYGNMTVRQNPPKRK